MERLTIIDGCGNPDLKQCMECGPGCGEDNENCGYCDKPYEAYAKLAAYEDSGVTPEEVAELARAKQEGRLQIIDKSLFCRNACKRDGKCGGYHENIYSHEILEMCAACKIYDPDAEEGEYYDDVGEQEE